MTTAGLESYEPRKWLRTMLYMSKVAVGLVKGIYLGRIEVKAELYTRMSNSCAGFGCVSFVHE